MNLGSLLESGKDRGRPGSFQRTSRKSAARSLVAGAKSHQLEGKGKRLAGLKGREGAEIRRLYSTGGGFPKGSPLALLSTYDRPCH